MSAQISPEEALMLIGRLYAENYAIQRDAGTVGQELAELKVKLTALEQIANAPEEPPTAPPEP